MIKLKNLKIKANVLITLLLPMMIRCQETKENNKMYENMDEIEQILIKQIEAGSDEEYGAYIDYGEEDLKALVTIEKTLLKDQGYKIPTKDDFGKKIKLLFDRTIVFELSTNFIKVEIYKDNKCDKKLDFYALSATAQYLYIDKNNRFITYFLPLPKIIDYLKTYPDLAKYEKESLIIEDVIEDTKIIASQWKDDKTLPEQRYFNQQLLIHRNKYLFNDNKASLAWLKFNDTYFLEALVKTFGYTEDKDLLNWVMECNKKESDKFLAENLFVKNCEGKLEVRKGILDYIENNTNNQNKDYFEGLSNLYYSYGSELNWDDFTKDEQYKMLGYLANTNDYLMTKYDKLGYQSNGRWTLLGSIYYNSTKDDDEKTWNKLIQKFKENNYYGLPHLKEAVDYAYNYESGSY